MIQHQVKYSIVIPVYNSAEFLSKTVEITLAYFKDQEHSHSQIILVDDGSSDSSWEIIKDLCNTHELVSGIKLGKNFGQHNATCAGITRAKGDFVLTMDDDMEFNIDNLTKLIDRQKDTSADLVYGVFDQSKGNTFIKAIRSIYAFVSRVVGDKNQVKGSSLRLMTKKLAVQIAKEASNFIFIDEVVFWYTRQIEFVEIERQSGFRKTSNYTPRKLLSLGIEVMMYSSLLPLKIIKRIGLLISIFMFFLGLFFIVKYLTIGVGVQGFTALIVTVAFSTGFIIYTLGTIGEYIGKIFRNVNNAPVFFVEEEVA